MPECSLVGTGMSTVPPLIVSPLFASGEDSRSSPLKYHVTTGAGEPDATQESEMALPAGWSRVFGVRVNIEAGSVK